MFLYAFIQVFAIGGGKNGGKSEYRSVPMRADLINDIPLYVSTICGHVLDTVSQAVIGR